VAGSGVTVTDIAQDYKAGTIEFTNNNLDLAINGSGFFQLDDGQGGVTYTRAGAFELNKEGYIVSKNGKFLQGYGLDADGNRLPIGDMAVTQKESPPKATENITLPFNIDYGLDATKLLSKYNKDEPGSFSWTTTTRTFDSLGNEHTIKYNFAEQRPVREQFKFTMPPGSPEISSVTVTPGDLPLPADQNTWPAWATELQAKDPRIDLTTMQIVTEGTPPVDYLEFELHAWATESGDVVVTDGTDPLVRDPANISSPYRDANEVRMYEVSQNTTTPGAGVIEFAGVTVNFETGDNTADIAERIAAAEAQILDRNPNIESVLVDSSDRIIVTFKADAGNIPDDEYVPIVNVTNGGTFSLGDDSSGTIEPNELVQGDNSFSGYYRLYAYLNGEELLDLGKVKDWGETGGGDPILGGGGETEPGPILIQFNPTNGLLRSVNGDTVVAGGQAPSITISGADPANSLTKINLDITGATQFASASIVKPGNGQDGYTKGDLIAVAFSSTGEMIASFSNGQDQTLGVVAIASFENQSGLQPSGDTEWSATFDSGDASLNPPGTGLNGTLRSAALEASNVDLSAELVKLIEGQRNYQANSKTLETMNTVTQTILQI
jgi:flagellar hook protein FlgE